GAHRENDPGHRNAQSVLAARTAIPPGHRGAPSVLGDRLGRGLLSQRFGDGAERLLPGVPSRRSVANTACTASTTPTCCAKNRRGPVRSPSSTPQKIFKRALTRSTAVRPLDSRSNFFVARGSAGKRLRSTSRGTRTVLPYDWPADMKCVNGLPFLG